MLICDMDLREEKWYCMTKSGIAETYVWVVQDIYNNSETVVRCVVGETDGFRVGRNYIGDQL